jgi:hypothetical protein
MRLLAALFGALPQGDRLRLAEAATEIHAGAAFLEALAMSHGDLARLLRDALRAKHPGPDVYCWTRDVYDDAVVYELSNKDDQTVLYQRSYAIADGAVTFGDPIRVVAVTQYMPAEQAEITVPATQVTQLSQPAEESTTELTGDLVPLVEKAVKKDGTASVKIIQAGQGSSGYYPADVLQRDGPRVFAAGTHIYLDHPSVSEERDRPERSVRDLAGSLTGPAEWKEDGTAGPGLYAPVKFIDSVAPHVNAIAAISGMSIRASGKAGTREVDGKKVRSIESIDVAHSIDVVTRPGAGGKVLDLIEAARGTPPAATTEDDGMSKEALEEANRKIAELEAREAERDKELARLREADLLRQAHGVVVAELAKAALPQPTRDRLTGQLAADPPVTDGALDRAALVAKVAEAAKAELDYLASVTGGNPVTGMGGGPADPPSVPTLDESEKRIAEAIKFL